MVLAPASVYLLEQVVQVVSGMNLSFQQMKKYLGHSSYRKDSLSLLVYLRTSLFLFSQMVFRTNLLLFFPQVLRNSK